MISPTRLTLLFVPKPVQNEAKTDGMKVQEIPPVLVLLQFPLELGGKQLVQIAPLHHGESAFCRLEVRPRAVDLNGLLVLGGIHTRSREGEDEE